MVILIDKVCRSRAPLPKEGTTRASQRSTFLASIDSVLRPAGQIAWRCRVAGRLLILFVILLESFVPLRMNPQLP